MIFSSLHFVLIFLPIFLTIYFITPYKFKNFWLLVGSLGFYLYGVRETPIHFMLLAASTGINFVVGKKIEFLSDKREIKKWFLFGILYNLSWLLFFKYTPFGLPLGISFYSFQATAYLADIYQRKERCETSFVRFGVYLCMFPKLISGPIVTQPSMKRQIHNRKHSFQKLETGLREFTLGLGLKVLLANQLSKLFQDVRTIGFESISTPLAWLGMISFSMQIYLDFYGYSLMAKGLGKIMGFEIPDNFKYPYLSVSVTEFYRRWHITLGAWFRDYVYISLGGNRRGAFFTIINLLIVWVLTGIWHGAGWNFVLWGLALFLLITIEKLGFIKILERFRVLGHLYLLFVISLSWVIFAITNMGDLKIYFGKLFPFLGWTQNNIYYSGDILKYLSIYAGSLIVSLLCCTNIPRKIYEKHKYRFLMVLFLVAVFWLCIYCMRIGTDDPFLYFRF